jgi:hypothetical protein
VVHPARRPFAYRAARLQGFRHCRADAGRSTGATSSSAWRIKPAGL